VRICLDRAIADDPSAVGAVRPLEGASLLATAGAYQAATSIWKDMPGRWRKRR